MMCAHGTCHGPQGQSKNLFIFEFLTMCTGLNTRDSCVHTFSSIFHLSSQLSISVILQHSSCLMCHLATCQLDTFVFSLISNVFFSFVFLSYTFTPLHSPSLHLPPAPRGSNNAKSQHNDKWSDGNCGAGNAKFPPLATNVASISSFVYVSNTAMGTKRSAVNQM
jgi:hypothetical protein